MRYLVVFHILIFLFACSEDSRDSSTQDSGIDNDIRDSSTAGYDSSSRYDSSRSIEDSSHADSEDVTIEDHDSEFEDSGLPDSDIVDSDVIDSDLSDTDIEDAKQTEEVITDEPTRIYLDVWCDEHYANNMRCPEEKCTVMEVVYNYTKGCPGKEHAHRYMCDTANPPKDDYTYMLVCICACADLD